nr:unnamed protein product [Haemonchus contortus]
MLFCLALVFVLINALAAGTNEIKPCVDEGGKDLCHRFKSKGKCLMGAMFILERQSVLKLASGARLRNLKTLNQ